MKRLVTGILAHVDAGKTTLSEALLYKTGEISNLGRVDKGDTLLDSNRMEKERGITIYSKQAHFSYNDVYVSLIDTPGHVDFSAEMERALFVLDYAILVISAVDGVQSHTRTLWRLFKEYNIPVFIFVNKIDQIEVKKDVFMNKLQEELYDGCLDFTNVDSVSVMEEIALLSTKESVLDDFMENKTLGTDIIRQCIKERKIIPCYFGSALKLIGIEEFLEGFTKYTFSEEENDTTPEAFGARVFRITTDKNKNRLTHLKVTSGKLVNRMSVNNEKINEIRIYNGDKYETVPEITKGYVCAVTGLSDTIAGYGLGCEKDKHLHIIEPVLTYSLYVPEEISERKFFPDLKKMEDEMPELSSEWDEEHQEIKVKLMGKIQIEILTSIIKERYHFVPTFGMGAITYKETIAKPVIGVGHFEPLKHYAEVHILIEPLPKGSGIQYETNVSEDILDKNWQRLIFTHLREKNHLGVLTKSEITDVKYTIINGRAHQKHTEGGDFRQATYRAIRQGLMQAENILLEPYYNFRLEIPSHLVGRAMMDIEKMHGVMEIDEQNSDMAIIKGYGPVSTMRDYQADVNAYTSGSGNLSVQFRGYEPCHNQDEIIDSFNYNPDNDMKNPSSSVFCAHGSGFIVPWYEVFDYMHVKNESEGDASYNLEKPTPKENFDYSIDLEEIDSILNKTSNANANQKKNGFKKHSSMFDYYNNGTIMKRNSAKHISPKKKVTIVDGYNVIFSWQELKNIVDSSMDGAKDRLIQILSNYSGIYEGEIIVVFDGYKKKNNLGSSHIQEQILVVHTKENETADSYIERFAHENQDKYEIRVVSSDGLIQTTVRSQNGIVVSSRDFEQLIEHELKNFLT